VWMRCGRCKGKHTPQQKKAQSKQTMDRKRRDSVYRAAQRESHARHRKRLRLEVIAGYGGECSCCGEQRTEFLVLDHTYGGGNEDRRARSATGAYYQAKREGCPPIFRVLCHNCNMSHAFYKYCPHEVERLNRDAMLKEKRAK
jgi:hypothetical protein